ncbi:MAG: KpsF/GutQ family sugar-phosphate isomerase [Candidatus Omnitrophica bacterium]|nr:KpsF/GutQ family sugar-phosphate isomerase [Candidatus Omnitrophota bacterium]
MSLKRAREVLRVEADAVRSLIRRVDARFERAVNLIFKCRGKVIVTGIGKPGLIGKKISATLASTGTPSFFMHPAEAGHGDLGMVTADDVVIAISNSGETEEVVRLLPKIKRLGAQVIAFTGGLKSTLARHADVVLDVGVKKEACPLGLAPTASTVATLAMGDALAVVLQEKRGFKVKDFAFYHPGGQLGKRLTLTVDDVMRRGAAHPIVREERSVKEALLTITKARAGAASIVNRTGRLVGIFTDGDLRRHLEMDGNISAQSLLLKNVMTKRPITVRSGRLAVEALGLLNKRRIDEIPVVDKTGRPVGMVDIQDLLKAGLFL